MLEFSIFSSFIRINWFNDRSFLFIYFFERWFLIIIRKWKFVASCFVELKEFNAFPFLFSPDFVHSQEWSRKRWNRVMFPQFSRNLKKGTDYTGGSQWAIVMRIQNGLTWPGCSLLLTLHFSEKRGRLCKLSSRATTARRYDETIPCTPFNFSTMREG